jgi:hypothetical protein
MTPSPGKVMTMISIMRTRLKLARCPPCTILIGISRRRCIVSVNSTEPCSHSSGSALMPGAALNYELLTTDDPPDLHRLTLIQTKRCEL